MQDPAKATSQDTATEQKGIGTTSCPECVLCGSKGDLIYVGLHDRLFGTKGTWNLRRCLAAACGTIWLDPRPLESEIWKAYESYYTHNISSTDSTSGPLKRAYYAMKSAYICNKYGYSTGAKAGPRKFLGGLLYLFPIRRGDVDTEIRYLHAIPNGSLLDVGCGSGEWLAMMGRLGWNSQGVDFDQNAVELARKNGLKVDTGTLESQDYQESSFDAITINHVIEHVPDPVALLKECRRILKPGGTIALATPNGQSLGHRIFMNNWRGLEPPRHLQILSPQATKTLFTSAGFKQITVRTYNSLYVWDQSYRLSRSHSQLDRRVKTNLSQKVISLLLTWYEQLFLLLSKSSGECIAAQGRK